MTHYEQSRDSNGRPVVKVDGVMQENVTIGGVPMESYGTDQAAGLRAMIARLEGLDDTGTSRVCPAAGAGRFGSSGGDYGHDSPVR